MEETKSMTDEMTIKSLNAEILKITMKIQEQYPELSKFLDEMPVTIPTKRNPEKTVNYLKTYHESLEEMLNKYKMDQPPVGNKKKGKAHKVLDLHHELPDPNNPNEIQGFPNETDSDKED